MKAVKSIQYLLCAAGAALSLQALADPKPGAYVGGGLTETSIDIDGVSGEANPTAVFARVGYQINEFFAVEGRLGTGLDSDKLHGVKVDIENVYGAYLKAGIPTAVGLYPYAVLGATHGELKASARGYSDTGDDDDISYGVGVDYWVVPNVSVGLEYMKYLDMDNYEVSGISLGANYRF